MYGLVLRAPNRNERFGYINKLRVFVKLKKKKIGLQKEQKV
jgi:hypothetical protein